MKITVIYTIPFREAAGVKEEPLEIEGDSQTVKQVLSMIVERHPSMSKFMESKPEETRKRQLVVAVNSRLAKFSDAVHDGDRVSLLLPVIGGS